ncbi:MAG: hypothetical protein OQJ97_12920 [Rhodospirillales bacterium]|nr:hypothetical protein [Rhodospirillales bacterium]
MDYNYVVCKKLEEVFQGKPVIFVGHHDNLISLMSIHHKVFNKLAPFCDDYSPPEMGPIKTFNLFELPKEAFASYSFVICSPFFPKYRMFLLKLGVKDIKNAYFLLNNKLAQITDCCEKETDEERFAKSNWFPWLLEMAYGKNRRIAVDELRFVFKLKRNELTQLSDTYSPNELMEYLMGKTPYGFFSSEDTNFFWGQLAWIFMLTGQLGDAWASYELSKVAIRRKDGTNFFPQPVWRGESLNDKSIVVWRDAGPGDDILYSDQINDLKKLGAQKIFFEVEDRLIPLMQRSFPFAEVVGRSDPSDTILEQADFQATSTSIFKRTRLKFSDFPKKQYLFPNVDRQKHRRDWVLEKSVGKPALGVCWRTSDRLNHSNYIFDALTWGKIFKLREFSFFCLQYDDCEEELLSVEKEFGINIQRFQDVDMYNDFDELSAIIKSLDYVVSINTVISNLAGALQVPSILLEADFCHTHLSSETSSPWYGQQDMVRYRHTRTLEEAIEKASLLLTRYIKD